MSLNRKYYFNNQKLLSVLQFLLISLIFALAYTQDPIYNSPENQNTKFLHGLAQAGYGLLEKDWTANTIDPLPAFTWLVQVTSQYIHSEYMFYLYYCIFLGVYVYSILAIVNYIYRINKSQLKYIVYLTSFIFIHTVHLKIFKFDSGKALHFGVAMQYVLGPVFQPSTFGVFIILSICCALYKKYFVAVSLLALAATFHPTYLVSAGILTLSYQIVILIREKKLLKAISVGLLSLVLILPVFSYMTFTFSPTSPELWSKAQELIVQFRIPHHSIPQYWIPKDGYTACIQTLLVIYALWLVRKTELFLILFLPFIVAVLSTIIQLIVKNETIAFIAPWRLSIFLVPISTGLILGRVLSSIFNKYQASIFKHQKRLLRSCIAIVSILVIAGTVEQVLSFGYGGDTNEIMDFVKEHKQSGETYLIPPDPNDLNKFRLYTGAPIFINDKTHPYKDTEILEWHKRLEQAREFYRANDRSCQILDDLVTNYSITHVILRQTKHDIDCDRLKEVYSNTKYQVAAIEK